MGLLSIPIFFLLVLILFAILFPRFMRAVFLIIGGLIIFAIIGSQFEPRSDAPRHEATFRRMDAGESAFAARRSGLY
jgi:peptidoglycan/LPS O-acetylase OafA/YrhL